jgi:capsid assembly protease
VAQRRRYEPSKDRILAIDPKAIGAEFDEGQDAKSETTSKVACIRIFGPIEQRAGWFGPGYDSILEAFRGAMSSDEIGAVLLHIDSPGGDAAGMAECVRAMIKAKRAAKKPVVALADESAYSAAFALTLAADETYLPETGGVGSIGCLCVAMDLTEAVRKAGVNAVVVRSGPKKAQGHPLIPLDETTLADMQSRVDGLANVFAQLVAESRGGSAAKWLRLKGACLFGDAAVKAGLADGILSFDEVMAGLIARVSASVPLDGAAQDVSPQSRGSKMTQGAKRMGLTELYAALSAAQAAGDSAKVASLNAQISAKKAEEDAEEEESDEESEEEESDEDAKDDDGDDDDDDDKDEPEEEEEETKRTTTTKTYRRAKKSQAIAAAVEDVFPGLSAAQVRGKLMALKDGQGRVEKLERQQKAMKTQMRNEEARKLVAQGVKAGKIPPSQKEYWLSQASKKDGVASLKEYLKTAIPVVATNDAGGFTPGPNVPGPGGLTVQESEICTRMGTPPADFLATKARMATQTASQIGETKTGFTITRPILPIVGGN